MKIFIIAWGWMWDNDEPSIEFCKAESLEKVKEYFWYDIMGRSKDKSITDIEDEAEVIFSIKEMPDNLPTYEGE